MFIHHLPSRGMGRSQEAKVWHGLSPPSTSSGGGGGKEIWASGCMGPSLSSPSLLTGRGGKKVTLLINTREDWPYTFMQLCKDSWHVPLSNVGHLSIMVDGAPSWSACRCLSHLDVHKLLQFGSEVVYPEGLNGGLELLWVPLPKQSIWDTESTNKPAILQVNLPRTTPRDKPIITLQQSSMPISTPNSVTECPYDISTGPNTAEEIEEFFSSTMLDMLGQPSVCISARRPACMAPNTPAASRG